MRYLLIVGALLGLIAAGCPAHAEPPAPSAPLEHNGVKGRWFSMPSAKKLL